MPLAAPLLGLAALSLADAHGRLAAAVSTEMKKVYEHPTWTRVRALLRSAHDAHRLPLLRRAADAARSMEVEKERLTEALTLTGPRAWEGVAVERLGTLYESLAPSLKRRRAGSHFTPRVIADEIARRTLSPLVQGASPDEVTQLRVCDPAMGAGAFLLAACRFLGTTTCIRGVDMDPVAVELAGASIWIEMGVRLPEGALVVGDALFDESLDWSLAFPDVLSRGGFDAFVGNPPWISFVGRAAQPMDAAVKKKLVTRYEAFAGYRNLQGVFIERCASLLAPGGRLGLLVPSSMSEQSGYAPTRRAHDCACVCDPALPDLGDSFEGVFQPCMALLSTKRKAPVAPSAEPWPIERPDMDAVASGIVRKMALPPLPPHLFGERGLQSLPQDHAHMEPIRDRAHTVPLRAGGDIAAFRRGEPKLFADTAWFGKRLRSPLDYEKVGVLIRQTARVPLACLSDGQAFRNSILAGFADDEHPAEFLVAYLNSAPIRWLHYTRNRDARQGMPQVKIGHLRALPRPPDKKLVGELADIGDAVSRKNEGASAKEQARIDALVAAAFDLDLLERARTAALIPR